MVALIQSIINNNGIDPWLSQQLTLSQGLANQRFLNSQFSAALTGMTAVNYSFVSPNQQSPGVTNVEQFQVIPSQTGNNVRAPLTSSQIGTSGWSTRDAARSDLASLIDTNLAIFQMSHPGAILYGYLGLSLLTPISGLWSAGAVYAYGLP